MPDLTDYSQRDHCSIDSLYVMRVRTISWHRFMTRFLSLWHAFSNHCQNRVCPGPPITTSWMVFKWQYVCNHKQIKIHQTAFLYPSTNKTQTVWIVTEQMFLPGVHVSASFDTMLLSLKLSANFMEGAHTDSARLAAAILEEKCRDKECHFNGITSYSGDPNTFKKKVKINAIYYDKTQHTHFAGRSLFHTTKHLNNS